MGWRLIVDPTVSNSLWLSLAAAGGVAMAWYAYRRPVAISRPRWAAVVALMTASLAALLLILLNPTWLEELPLPSGKPVVTVLLDDSASMATKDGKAGERRINSAAKIAETFHDRLSNRFDVRLRRFSDSVRVVSTKDLSSLPAEGMSTDIADAVKQTLTDEANRDHAILLLSDGIDNAGGSTALLEVARSAKASATPIYPVAIGGTASIRDVVVEFRASQELSFVGESALIGANVRHEGFDGASVLLTLVEQPIDGSPEKVVERRTIVLGHDSAPAAVPFELKRDKPGVYRFELRADPITGEATSANNAALLVLRVVDEPIRILLLEGKPYWDAKFLLRTLTADRSVNVDAYIRVRHSRFHHRRVHRLIGKEVKGKEVKGKGTKGKEAEKPESDRWEATDEFDKTFAKQGGLRSFQILVLGRDADAFLTDSFVAELKNWVARDGGSVVCFRGSPMATLSDRLVPLMPVRWTPGAEARFQMKLTPRAREMQWFSTADGRASEDLAAELPTLARRSTAETPTPLAVVLAESSTSGAINADPSPAFSFQPYGSGRVVAIEGAGMWRWAFLPPDRQSLDSLYPRLWRGLIRWLVSSVDLLPGQSVALRPDKLRFEPTEHAGAMVLVRENARLGGAPLIELTVDGGAKPQTFAAAPLGDDQGVYRARFGKLSEGRYSARIVGDPSPSASAVFEVRTGGEERLHLRARPDVMARLAVESGGSPIEWTSTEDVVVDFERQRSLHEPRVRREPAWDRWWVMLGVFTAWTTCWGLRRSWGLI